MNRLHRNHFVLGKSEQRQQHERTQQQGCNHGPTSMRFGAAHRQAACTNPCQRGAQAAREANCPSILARGELLRDQLPYSFQHPFRDVIEERVGSQPREVAAADDEHTALSAHVQITEGLL